MRNSRTSMISSAAALIGARGLSGTSFSDVLADSGAPRGSIYHHFPGGKKQLAGDVIAWTSEQILGYLRRARGPGGPDRRHRPGGHGRRARHVPRGARQPAA
jgi:AcrR family transcriptional regulator